MGESKTARVPTPDQHAAVPFWRDVRVLRWLFQLAILVVVGALLYFLINNLVTNLARLGLNLSFTFLNRPAGFNISEGYQVLQYDHRTSRMWHAFAVGVLNTLRAAGVGIILATILGTIVGVARLSRNWLVSRVSLAYIEIMQNTPLLVQLFFWFTLVKALPRQRPGEILVLGDVTLGPLTIPPLAYFSQRAVALPGIEIHPSFRLWWPFLVVGLVVAAGLWLACVRMKERRGEPPTGQFWWAAGGFAAVLAVGWVLVPGAPVSLVLPGLEGETIAQYTGGWILSNTFQALLLGLVLYTAAFIAEVVRSGIQSVPYGQIEAATSLGLSRQQQLRLIVLPQAMRVIIPPLINQYLNLIKNSSLAIAVGYPDLFNISQTIGNQTGQNIQVIALVMATYLVISLIVSAIMNVANQRMQIVER